MAIGMSKKAEVDKMILRPQDPKSYGHICPACQKRWGEPTKEIEILRCATCPPFHASGVYWYGVKAGRAMKKMRQSLLVP